MDELQLRHLIEEVRAGRRTRRGFINLMVQLGLTAPLATAMLAQSGIAAEAAPYVYKPTKRGGGGPLKLLWWEAATLLNPHFAVGNTDQDASRVFYEPLANWDKDGNLMPILAAEVPTIANGGLAEDGLSVTWKLRKGVKWHDGAPFTADDCVFNWQYASDPATAATTIGSYNQITVTKIDDHTIKISFKKPTPYWADAFVGVRGMIIPKHLFEKYKGANSRQAPANLAPVGTGPYLFVEFRPGDMVRAKINPNYYEPNHPYFDTIDLKGGGSPASAARAVLETSEYDFAWDVMVQNSVLQGMLKAKRGRLALSFGSSLEHIQLNYTNPWVTVDGQRSSIKTKNPVLSDPAVRHAMNYLIDRAAVHKFIYGPGGIATANVINAPKEYVSKTTSYEFSIPKAIKLLEGAGWKVGAGGIREKNGVKMHLTFATSVNGARQENQEIVKQACQKAGISLDLKAVLASVFFSSDVSNPDTYSHFYNDMQMYTTDMPQPDPGTLMSEFVSWEVAQKSNDWEGLNIVRWQNAAYDALYKQAQSELDTVKRAALFVKMNDMVVDNVVVIPELWRPVPNAASNSLHVRLSGWDSTLSNLRDWYRET